MELLKKLDRITVIGLVVLVFYSCSKVVFAQDLKMGTWAWAIKEEITKTILPQKKSRYPRPPNKDGKIEVAKNVFGGTETIMFVSRNTADIIIDNNILYTLKLKGCIEKFDITTRNILYFLRAKYKKGSEIIEEIVKTTESEYEFSNPILSTIYNNNIYVLDKINNRYDIVEIDVIQGIHKRTLFSEILEEIKGIAVEEKKFYFSEENRIFCYDLNSLTRLWTLNANPGEKFGMLKVQNEILYTAVENQLLRIRIDEIENQEVKNRHIDSKSSPSKIVDLLVQKQLGLVITLREGGVIWIYDADNLPRSLNEYFPAHFNVEGAKQIAMEGNLLYILTPAGIQTYEFCAGRMVR